MHRKIALLGVVTALAAVMTGLGGPTAPPSDAAPPVAAVKQVDRAYGQGPVRLGPGQGVDVTFQARRGHSVMLDVRSRTSPRYASCFGTQTLVDGRGPRRTRINGPGSARIMSVRTSGQVTLRFRGTCSANKRQEAHPVIAQLIKVRTRQVDRDARTRVRAPRRGFLDVAWVRVARHARDTLTLRSGSGVTQHPRYSRVLVGDRLWTAVSSHGISVEAGHRVALTPSTWNLPGRLRPGQRVGLVVSAGGYAESLRSRVHQVALDGPALTLPAEPGREHVLVYRAETADRAYLLHQDVPAAGTDPGHTSWYPWVTYTAGADRADATLHRTIVASDADGADSQSLQVRMRRTVRVPDLVVDGAPVSFASVEPGTRFVATIPASAAGNVRLSATDVSVTGAWGASVPPVVCPYDCLYPGLTVGDHTLVADGVLHAVEPHELNVTFDADATGHLTLRLTDIP